MLFTLQRYEFFSKSQQLLFLFLRHSWCCLPYKGTNFSANHNCTAKLQTIFKDVVYPTKVRIFQQITTNFDWGIFCGKMLFTLQRYEFFSKSQPACLECLWPQGCCLPYKGTNFSANHNRFNSDIICGGDVVYPTKVRIFQQITTKKSLREGILRMLFTLQRYEFFSKSQLPNLRSNKKGWCCLPYKGTNFSANHNSSATSSCRGKMLFTLQRYEFFSKSQRSWCIHHSNCDVVYPTKVRIFQQITTVISVCILSMLMLFTLQRYEFFSK